MSSSDKTGKPTASWSTHDNACNRCRERKIRCGRERPRCANCKRDGATCGYCNPGKRVNHIKLLCNNVGGVEDRLGNIEAELSFMNSLLKTSGNRRLSTDTAMEGVTSGELSIHDPLGEDNPCLPPKDRYIVRNSSKLTDRYHGPCSLFALCNGLRDTLLSAPRIQTSTRNEHESQRNKEHGRPAISNVAKDLLDRICLEAGTEESVDLQADAIPIRLPPRQFLSMAQTQFFQQADYETDIFVQTYFRSNVERVYNRAFTPADEAWAICFNTIILLVLGPESSFQDCDSMISSQFVRPFLLTVLSAISNPQVLMTAKLVNVQALALLSVAARMYYPLHFAESIVAQACVLARTMGLNQVPSAPDGVSSEEAQERIKVFTSLYLRDKSLSMLQGSICWLSSFDCSPSSNIGESLPVDSRFGLRIQLARLQDETYQLFHSADLSRNSSAKYKSAKLRIEQDLEHWANANELFSSPSVNRQDVDLQLEFLAARICVFRRLPEPKHVDRALNDSRASCLLVVISYEKHESSMIEQLDELFLSMSPPQSFSRRASGRSSESGEASSSDSMERNMSEMSRSRLRSPLDSFSVPAFFLLATNIVCSSSAYDQPKAEEDLNLLQKVCACYKEHDARTRANNHIRKVGRAFESLLQAISLIKSSQQCQPPHSGMQQNNNADHTPGTSSSLGEQHPFPDSSNLPSPSISAIAPTSWDNFSNKDASTTTPGNASVSAQPGLLTPMDSQYHDPLWQPRFFPHMQQQSMHPAISNRPQTSDSDVPMNYYADSRSLSEFLATNTPVSF